jgi:hypothetical protein
MDNEFLIDTSVRDEIFQKYQDFIEAVLTKNRSWMEENIADDFHLWLVPTGTTLNKADYITSAISVPGVKIEMIDVQVHHTRGIATSHVLVKLFEEWSGEVDEEAARVMSKSRIGEIKTFSKLRASVLNGAWRKTPTGWKIFQHVYVDAVED